MFCTTGPNTSTQTGRGLELRYGDPLDLWTTWWWLWVAKFVPPPLKAGEGPTYALPFANLAHEWQLEERLAQLERRRSLKFSVILIGAGPNGVELACKLG